MARGRKGRRGQQAYTPKAVERLKGRLLREIALGVPLGHAPAVAGFSFDTYQAWRTKDPEWGKAVDEEVRAYLGRRAKVLAELGDGRRKGSVPALIFELVNRCRREEQPVWVQVAHAEVAHTVTGSVDVEHHLASQIARIAAEDDEFKTFRRSLATAHASEKAKGGNGGNGGNGER